MAYISSDHLHITLQMTYLINYLSNFTLNKSSYTHKRLKKIEELAFICFTDENILSVTLELRYEGVGALQIRQNY